MELEKNCRIKSKAVYLTQVFLGYMKKQYDNLSNKHIEDRLGRNVIESDISESDSTASDNEEDEDNKSNYNSDVENNSDNENNNDSENTENKKEV